MRQNGFKIETKGKVYYCQAPDEMSLQAWMAALRPLKVGFLMKQGQEVQSWKKRWCMLWRTQLAYFETHEDTTERKGYILLRDTIPDRVFAVDHSVFGHDNIFQVETRERTFFMQAISGEDMDEWLHHVNTAIQSRGPAEPEMGAGELGNGIDFGADAGGAAMSEGVPGGGAPVYDDGIGEDMPQDEVAAVANLQRQEAQQLTAEQLRVAEARLNEREADLQHREAVLQRKIDTLAAAGHHIDFTPAPAPAPQPVAVQPIECVPHTHHTRPFSPLSLCASRIVGTSFSRLIRCLLLAGTTRSMWRRRPPRQRRTHHRPRPRLRPPHPWRPPRPRPRRLPRRRRARVRTRSSSPSWSRGTFDKPTLFRRRHLVDFSRPFCTVDRRHVLRVLQRRSVQRPAEMHGLCGRPARAGGGPLTVTPSRRWRLRLGTFPAAVSTAHTCDFWQLKLGFVLLCPYWHTHEMVSA